MWIQGLLSGASDEILNVPPPEGLVRVVLFAGGSEDAQRLAKKFPNLGLIIYSTNGDPSKQAMHVAGSVLISAGDKCRYLGSIALVGGEWKNFSLIELGPEKPDDSVVTNIYKSYLRRVTDEKLLDALPRFTRSTRFVGSKACGSCHGKTHGNWLKTAHARAYPTLRQTGNERDPECVGCHVVGLDDASGFRSLGATAQLANVGCESCHGPGRDHLKWPKNPYGKAGEASCLKCHNVEHSPQFEFEPFWAKIKH